MLPIGVVLPTRNSAAHLPRHLESMQAWVDLVQEIVVVDSDSTDGTVDLIKTGLKHERLTVLNHPPGLYQSWNHGIAKITAPYVYLSTVGDTITGEGLQRFCQTAQKLDCDVVLSKPNFFSPAGNRLRDIHWPIDEIINSLGLKRPRRLKKTEAVLFALTSSGGAMTGSCASDLFRTRALQRHPFPTEFGVAGDGAWGIKYAAYLSWAVEPGRFSTFLKHPPNVSEPDRKNERQAPAWEELARQAVEAARRDGALTGEEWTCLKMDELLGALVQYQKEKQAFDVFRNGSFPWILNPVAWGTRVRRNQALESLREIKRQVLGRT
jgi:glycosyltransferase involved in cell wall biosynthesis